MKPTQAQINALLLALEGSIRYYKGGYYSSKSIFGRDQESHPSICMKADYTTLGTLRACVSRGWMEYVVPSGILDCDVYKRRWKITNEGINIVNEVMK